MQAEQVAVATRLGHLSLAVRSAARAGSGGGRGDARRHHLGREVSPALAQDGQIAGRPHTVRSVHRRQRRKGVPVLMSTRARPPLAAAPASPSPSRCWSRRHPRAPMTFRRRADPPHRGRDADRMPGASAMPMGTIVPMPAQGLALEAGSGRVIALPGAVASVFAADPKVAEVRPASPDQPVHLRRRARPHHDRGARRGGAPGRAVHESPCAPPATARRRRGSRIARAACRAAASASTRTAKRPRPARRGRDRRPTPTQAMSHRPRLPGRRPARRQPAHRARPDAGDAAGAHRRDVAQRDPRARRELAGARHGRPLRRQPRRPTTRSRPRRPARARSAVGYRGARQRQRA